MPLDAARDTVIVVQTRVIEALAAENARLAGQVSRWRSRSPRQVIQHDLHEAASGSGRVHQVAARPGARAPGTVTYGPDLQSQCVYLIAAHAIPVHRCAELIEALTGARPSPGFVHTMIARAAASDLRIPPTSNDAERDLRPAIQQKISGRLRSEQATRHRQAIRGYLSIAAKHGINVLAALRDALEGHPWMPPIPDPP